MGNSRLGYVLGLQFFALFFWCVYLRVVFDSLVKSLFKSNTLTYATHWLIHNFSLNEFNLKFLCILLSLAAFYLTKSYTKERPDLQKLYWIVAISFAFMLYPFVNVRALPVFISLPILIVCMPLFLFSLIRIKKILYSKKIDQDQFNLENQSFPQESEVVETPNSLNFLNEYYYEGKKFIGAINLVEIFRSIWIYGVMGSGKTFSFLLPCIYQLIKKDFTLAVYDNKFPSMSKATYNYYKALKPEANFYQLCFTDMRFSNKCNAIEPKYIPNSIDIKNASSTILKNLSKGGQENPFFTGSAEGILSALIAMQKKMQLKYDIEVCSVPHAVILASVKVKYLIPILLAHKDILLYITSLRDAFDGGAAEEQLAGQTATLQQKLSDLVNKDFFFIASGQSDFSLDLNDPFDKKILTIGGAGDKAEAISPFTSLYFEIISKRVNKPGKHKFMKVIDEFAQMYYQGIMTYLETGRENKAGIIAGLQGVAQMYKKMPQREAEAILDIQGTVITGMAGKKTAELVSDRIGKTNQKRSSVTDRTGDPTVNHTFYEAPLIPPSRIANFSSGDFCGVVTDEFKNKIEQKRFMGTVLENEEVSSIDMSYELPQIHSFENSKTIAQYRDHLARFKEIDFYNSYKSALLANEFVSLDDDILFYLKFLSMDKDFLKSEFKRVRTYMSDRYQKDSGKVFNIDNYINKFSNSRLKKTILDNEKEAFLNNYMDGLYEEVEYWVRKEYLEVTGKSIDDDLFKIDNYQTDERDNLYF